MMMIPKPKTLTRGTYFKYKDGELGKCIRHLKYGHKESWIVLCIPRGYVHELETIRYIEIVKDDSFLNNY